VDDLDVRECRELGPRDRAEVLSELHTHDLEATIGER
jgi:hypothetical protein